MNKLLSSILLNLSIVSAAQAAIPGMKGADHIGVTVPDIEQAVNFFVDVVGCEPFINLALLPMIKATG